MLRGTLWCAVAGLALAVTLAAMAPAKLEKALASQRALVEAHPQDADLWNDLANLLILADRLDEAETAYRRALEIDSGLVSAHFNLGLLLQQKGRLAAAEESYRRAVKLDPSHAWSHYQLGTVYEARDRRRDAVEAYAKALSLDQSLLRPEVNPHILDNRLLTRASLEAYARISARPSAPRSYMEPGRIGDLLVPPVAGEGTVESEDSAQEETKAGQQGRVLGKSSLEPDKRVGQATPQPLPPPTVGGDPRYRQSPSRSLPTGGVRQPQAGGNRRFIPPTVVAPPPPSSEDDESFRPSVLSTGRLELRLRTAPQLQTGDEQSG